MDFSPVMDFQSVESKRVLIELPLLYLHQALLTSGTTLIHSSLSANCR
jgi:hypothetical protein